MSEITKAGNYGSICALWRFPIKSMMGEEVNSVDLTEKGVFGDRAYACIDSITGKIASAKNPSKWPNFFEFRSVFVEPPSPVNGLPAVRITLPDGSTAASDQADIDSVLSRELGRPVTLKSTAPDSPELEEYWPEVDGLPLQKTTTVEPMPSGTFFDLAVLHLISTSSLNALRAQYPAGRFEIRRFRPNLVVDIPGVEGFVEGGWIGKEFKLGDAIIKITDPCARCVMTTLPQYDLPRDPGILRAAVQGNQAQVGVFCSVLQPGLVKKGDKLELV